MITKILIFESMIHAKFWFNKIVKALGENKIQVSYRGHGYKIIIGDLEIRFVSCRDEFALIDLPKGTEIMFESCLAEYALEKDFDRALAEILA